MTKSIAHYFPSHHTSYTSSRPMLVLNKKQKQKHTEELNKLKAATHSTGVRKAFMNALSGIESLPNAFLKPIYQTVGLLEHAVGVLPTGITNLGNLASNTKNFVAGPKFILGLNKFIGSVKRIFTVKKEDKTSTTKRVAKAFFDGNGTIGDLHDFIHLLWSKGVVKASSATMKRFKFIQYSSLGIGNIKDLIVTGKQFFKGEKFDKKTGRSVAWGDENGKKLGRRKLTSQQKKHRTMNIAKNVSFLGLATIGLLGLLFTVKVAVGVLVSATLATVAWNAAYYYKNLAKPDEKAQYAWLKNRVAHH